MAIKQNILYSLAQSRKMAEGMIEALKTQDDWMYQAHPKANHAMWIVGHLGLADNMFLSKLNPEADAKPEGWDELFWFGSEVSSDATKYPSSDEVLSFFRERREKLLAAIEGLSDEFLNSPTPNEGMFADAPNMAQMLIFTSYHEGIHSGQLSIAHRGLGNAPLFQPAPAESA